ncbi:uncharacterized protein LOC113238949 isoform X2 [Hyposmocoma kahamanoa]|uniref:uncharacterized protein LOC113238949 isoform X2 n=1 Tax=Hyposmocoma kahamanoa TaxID=1477025 RepID=UPI000E6D9390|nr:uncharacterized protein LOC113238949 isoform X2 [Hyposmocoma kahamanoa]
MNIGRSDASTSTDDIKGRPLCLFYFAHPFGVLSCEPPAVLTAASAPAPASDAPAPASPSPPSAMRRAPALWRRPDPHTFGSRLLTVDLSSVGNSLAFSSSTESARLDSRSGRDDFSMRRPVPYGRALPPLRLPTPRNASTSDDASLDAWARRPPNERFALPPLDMNTTVASGVRVDSDSELSCRGRATSRHAPPAGVRKVRRARLCPRTLTARAALARLLRRKGATGGAGGAGVRAGSLLATLGALRAGWTPPPHTITRFEVRGSTSSAIGSEGEERWSAGAMLRRAAPAELSSRVAASPGLLRRRYSVPETVMRRCRLARQWSEPERASTSGRSPGSSPSRGANERSVGARESVRRCALLRRMWGRNPNGAGAAPSPPCCCGSRSLDGSHTDLEAVRLPRPSERRRRSPLPYTESYARTSSTVPSGDGDTVDLEPDRPIMETYDLAGEPRFRETSTIGDTSGSRRSPDPPTDDFPARPHAPYDLLEIAVSETSHGSDSPDRRAVRATPPSALRTFKPSIMERNIDEYVADILVESLNSLTDRLETIAATTEGRMSVIEKEIKVKLQNAGVNTVVHLSPTSNHQIIFGNEELCERDASATSRRVQSLFEGGEPIEDRRRGTDDRDLQFPPPQSAEANPATGASAGSPCTSLVDSLDDPSSPRFPLGIDSTVSNRPGENNTSRGDRSESFFIRLEDDECDCAKDNLVVADRMPERIKKRLQRRHRRRERRAEVARRGRTGGSRSDRNRGAAVERTCAALVDSLVDDAISRIAREEYRCARIGRRLREETRAPVDASRQRTERRLALAPEPAPAPRRDRAPRRSYRKSEIHDGEKCIEILEIVEYANVSRSSSDVTSDECGSGVKCRRSRIPVPVPDESRRPGRAGAVRAAPPSTATAPPPAPAAATAAHAARRASVPSCDGRLRTDSLRFERVFDAIPEERGGLGSESSRPSSGAPPDPRSPRRLSTAAEPSAPSGGANPIAESVEASAAAVSGRRSVGVQCATVVEDDSEAAKSDGRRFRSTSAGRSDADEVADLTHTHVPASSDGESADERRAPRRPPPRDRRPRPPHAHAHAHQSIDSVAVGRLRRRADANGEE